MLEVEDYILVEKIYESEYILVYRAIRKKDQSKVILKIGVLDSSSIESIQN